MKTINTGDLVMLVSQVTGKDAHGSHKNIHALVLDTYVGDSGLHMATVQWFHLLRPMDHRHDMLRVIE